MFLKSCVLFLFFLLSVHIEKEVVLGVRGACYVDVSPTVVDMHDVVDDVSAITGTHLACSSNSCIGNATCDVLVRVGFGLWLRRLQLLSAL